MKHGPFTHATLDELYRIFTENVETTRSGKPVFSLVVSRRTSAQIEQAWLRGFKRRARRKALKRQ